MEYRWQRIQDIYEGALELPIEVRSCYIRNACGDNLALSAEVESLVRAYEQAGGFLESEPPRLAAEPGAEEDLSGRRIGPYRLLEILGRGGMAAVYLAERDDAQYRKRVAIKLINTAAPWADLAGRFRRERQILAGLEHPNIARLLDGGAAEDGTPYYVMEYVPGRRIDAYCDQNRLSIRERVRLFCKVCAAVEFAHWSLVVHRDIKPSNVLVTPDGTPKLLDFGIAKLLAPAPGDLDQDLASAAIRIMTPSYCSPEQVRGEAITTATDVYSLGVVLYELLAGCRPYRISGTSPEEAARVVCSQVPEHPSAALHRGLHRSPAGHGGCTSTPGSIARARSSTPERLVRELSGDLDSIVAKAIAKEPSRRYASAAQLGDDLVRYLEGRPVLARPDSFAYRAGRFVRRHWAGTLAAALFTFAFGAGTTATVYQAHVARGERLTAERRFEDLHTLVNSFLFEFDDAIRNIDRATPARVLVVRRALEYLDKLDSGSATHPGFRRDLAIAYDKVSDIQANLDGPSPGGPEAALASARRALSIRESLAASHPANPLVQRELALSYRKVAELARQTRGR